MRKALVHLRRQWIGVLALFLVLTGSTAYALAGHNTVFSDDIVNGEVASDDVHDNSLTYKDIKEATVEPDAFGRFHDGVRQVPDGSGINGNPRAGNEDVLSLDVPAGNYYIVAKGTLSWAQQGNALCFLYADGDYDRLDIYSNGPFFMSVLGGSVDPFTIHLACNDKRQNVQLLGGGMLDLKINAIAIRGITNTAG